ncbi:DUF2000 family protein [Acidovorax sp. Root402]|uniref:DUF2000 family protein n=1 Tax=Acidovorax sp. Root402 TaxID=1736527 RepID=UPI0006FB2893|nr:DUF2000 family protein [Acidovorax sp. Root402]KQW27368.1 hypothetical protein ASC83_23195 [Acidovorax sp. Root402]
MHDTEQKAQPDKVAVVVAASLTAGQAANIAACLAAGLAGARPGWAGGTLVDADDLETVASSHLPIAVLSALPEAMSALLRQAIDIPAAERGEVSLFPAYAQSVHDFAQYRAHHQTAHHVDEPMLGIGLAGPKRWVNRLTGSLPLWR